MLLPAGDSPAIEVVVGATFVVGIVDDITD
jgi:hypothetical protein